MTVEEEVGLLNLFLSVTEEMAKQPPEILQLWHDMMKRNPTPPGARDEVLLVEPCIQEFLSKLAYRKRLMH